MSVCLSLSLSLSHTHSLSLSHTHTHTHTLQASLRTDAWGGSGGARASLGDTVDDDKYAHTDRQSQRERERERDSDTHTNVSHTQIYLMHAYVVTCAWFRGVGGGVAVCVPFSLAQGLAGSYPSASMNSMKKSRARGGARERQSEVYLKQKRRMRRTLEEG